jgi:hypothetical protein
LKFIGISVYYAGSLKEFQLFAEVAQLVEHIPEEDGVGGSSPPLGTFGKYPAFAGYFLLQR